MSAEIRLVLKSSIRFNIAIDFMRICSVLVAESSLFSVLGSVEFINASSISRRILFWARKRSNSFIIDLSQHVQHHTSLNLSRIMSLVMRQTDKMYTHISTSSDTELIQGLVGVVFY